MSEEQTEQTQQEQAPDVIAKALQDLVVAEGTLTFDAVPRVKYLVRPAPVPEGSIAVMLRSFRTGYFLVKLNKECKGCGGDGIDKRKDASTALSEIPYCPACIHTEIQHFGRCWELKVAEREFVKDQDERAERADKNLEARLTEARERVAKLEKERDEVLGQNKLDVEQTRARIEVLKKDAERFDEQNGEYKRRLKEQTKDFASQVEAAKALRAEKMRLANEELASSLAQIKHRQDTYASEHGKCLEKLANMIGENCREQAKAEDALKKYEAGPAKIAKRWEEKIEPARKTLARLEKRWNA